MQFTLKSTCTNTSPPASAAPLQYLELTVTIVGIFVAVIGSIILLYFLPTSLTSILARLRQRK
jgi:H+/gluconate symporter-like permease